MGDNLLYVANERKLLAVVPASDPERVSTKIRLSHYRTCFTITGEVMVKHLREMVAVIRLGAS